MADNENEKQEQTPSAKKGFNQIILGAVLLFGLAIISASAAVATASIVLGKPEAEPAAAGADADEEGRVQSGEAQAGKGEEEIYSLKEAMIANVRGTQGRRYLSVKPVFGVVGDGALKQIEEKEVELTDLLISILKTKTLDQLEDPQITKILAREILETANAKLEFDPGIAISQVYFTQFVVQ